MNRDSIKTDGAIESYGLYLHIPYCRGRCRYCDFHSAGGHEAVPDAYVDALLKAFSRFAPADDAGRALRPATLYLGGGTPGLLTPVQLEKLIGEINPLPGAEITLEANPRPALPTKLAGFRRAGANRLSLGVQSAHDKSLRLLGRPHTAEDAKNALHAAQKAGFANISGDIMLALPGYTNAEFDDTLALLRAGGVNHVSAYLLKLEPGTPLAENPPAALPKPDETAEQYLYACEALEKAGYAQYEISNFAREGFESRHNLLYWRCGNWLGLGPGAHSCLGGNRFSFPADTEEFLGDGASPAPEGTLDAEDRIMLELRLSEGLPEKSFTGPQKSLFSSLQRAGLSRRTEGGNFALTPRGMLVQNSILARLLDES